MHERGRSVREDIYYTVMRNFAWLGSFVIGFKATGTIIVWITGEAVVFFRN